MRCPESSETLEASTPDSCLWAVLSLQIKKVRHSTVICVSPGIL